MIPRGQFHIPATTLIGSFFNLWRGDYFSEVGVSSFKSDLTKHLAAKQVELFSSCRIAFYSYLKDLNLPKGSEVLLTPITIPDMVNALVLNGLKPVFVEMDKADHSFNISDLKNKISGNTKLILSTSLCGLRPKNRELFEISKENNLLYIEDISQSPVQNYFEQDHCAQVTVISLSVGKTITTLVGGALAFGEKSTFKRPEFHSYPLKDYFKRQLRENLKIDIFTSPFIYRFFTRFCLALLSIFNKDYYFNIHKQNLVSKYNELDIFFDDIPVLRVEFPKNLFFRFNSWMAKLGQATLNNWHSSLSRRKAHRELFLREASDKLKSITAANFSEDDYFPLRAPFYVERPEEFQLFCIKRGLDCGNYGLNLCNEEEVFQEFRQSLPISREIKEHCFFLNLNEKLKRDDIVKSIKILNDYFGE
ncbi:hypothetical protein A9Q84_19235 [Halobacteriovorax marinus]|uniref:DegT/DnrJ/EryC1/StrS aminotransferase family protein n=1 Tax=Halobacteriovorax marinus TaxID=97084 RepID=A0A1Y5F2H3_9BACT|nr:hypothetical protein A9Q84_19235 [Halobacteriovorax marinus]